MVVATMTPHQNQPGGYGVLTGNHDTLPIKKTWWLLTGSGSNDDTPSKKPGGYRLVVVAAMTPHQKKSAPLPSCFNNRAKRFEG
jgi:hypothetical protein